MPEYQTTVQDATAILRGSAMLELSAYAATPSWTDAGTLSGLEVAEVMEVNKEENDNADADELVTKQEMTIKANLHEALSSTIWSIMRTGFDTTTPVAAAEVAGDTYTFAADSTIASRHYELPGQNSTGLVQTITTIVKTGPTTLVAGTDYISSVGSNGKWGITFIAGDKYDATKAMVVTYTYTPSASLLTQSGDKTVLPWFMARITTKNDGTAFVTTVYKCKITKGREWKFPKDDDTDRRVKVPIEIICKPDALYNTDFVYGISQEGGL